MHGTVGEEAAGTVVAHWGGMGMAESELERQGGERLAEEGGRQGRQWQAGRGSKHVCVWCVVLFCPFSLLLPLCLCL